MLDKECTWHFLWQKCWILYWDVPSTLGDHGDKILWTYSCNVMLWEFSEEKLTLERANSLPKETFFFKLVKNFI